MYNCSMLYIGNCSVQSYILQEGEEDGGGMSSMQNVHHSSLFSCKLKFSNFLKFSMEERIQLEIQLTYENGTYFLSFLSFN